MYAKPCAQHCESFLRYNDKCFLPPTSIGVELVVWYPALGRGALNHSLFMESTPEPKKKRDLYVQIGNNYKKYLKTINKTHLQKWEILHEILAGCSHRKYIQQA